MTVITKLPYDIQSDDPTDCVFGSYAAPKIISIGAQLTLYQAQQQSALSFYLCISKYENLGHLPHINCPRLVCVLS